MSKSIKVLREQKEEYMEHLFDVVYEPFIRIYQQIYQDVLKSKECTAKNVLKVFQHELSKIPDWNQIKVEEVYEEVVSRGKCSYFPELMKTVYVLTIKIILLGIPEENRSKVKIRIPGPETFVHRCLIHIARELWKRPYLFYHQARSIDRQNNIYHCEVIVRKKLRAVIRETIPMEWMVVQFNDMDHIQEKEESSSSEEEEEVSDEGESSEEEEQSEEESEEEQSEEESEEEQSEEESEEEQSDAQKEQSAEEEQSDKESEEPQLLEEKSLSMKESDIEEDMSDVESEDDKVVYETSPVDVPRIEVEPVNIILPTHTVQLDSDLSSSSDSSSESEEEIIKVEQDEPDVITVHEIPRSSPVPEPPQEDKKLIHIHESKKHRRHHKKKDAFF